MKSCSLSKQSLIRLLIFCLKYFAHWKLKKCIYKNSKNRPDTFTKNNFIDCFLWNSLWQFFINQYFTLWENFICLEIEKVVENDIYPIDCANYTFLCRILNFFWNFAFLRKLDSLISLTAPILSRNRKKYITYYIITKLKVFHKPITSTKSRLDRPFNWKFLVTVLYKTRCYAYFSLRRYKFILESYAFWIRLLIPLIAPILPVFLKNRFAYPTNCANFPIFFRKPYWKINLTILYTKPRISQTLLLPQKAIFIESFFGNYLWQFFIKQGFMHNFLLVA